MKRPLVHTALSQFMIALLFLPLGVGLWHALEHKHEPSDCAHLETHLHQDTIDCSLDDWQLNPYDYSVFHPEVDNKVEPFYDLIFTAVTAKEQHILLSLRDRGPPAAA